MVEYGGPASNYVRTSRVRIELNPDGDTNIPADVADTLDDTLPARLFVHDIVVKRDVANRIGYANVADYISFTSEVINKVRVEVAEYRTSRPYGIESIDGVGANVKMVKGHDIEMLQATEASEEKVAANVSMQEAVLRDILIETAIDPDSVKADVVVSSAIQVDLLTEISIEQDEVKADMTMTLAKLDDVLLATDTTPENLTANVTVIGAVLSDE
jgi:transcriptional regulator CtsR